jgi:hypothetical protein
MSTLQTNGPYARKEDILYHTFTEPITEHALSLTMPTNLVPNYASKDYIVTDQ